MMTTWNEMTMLEQMDCLYSDMYKDAHGFRPRGVDTSRWTEEDFRREFDYLQQVIEAGDKARSEAEARSITKFAKRIEETIQAGAGDRETALRWIMEADDCGGDWEFLCWMNGLPYGFFNK